MTRIAFAALFALALSGCTLTALDALSVAAAIAADAAAAQQLVTK